MERETERVAPAAPMRNSESINSNLDAIPNDPDNVEGRQLEYGNMNEKDARASGYTDGNGQAVEKAKPEVKDEPTGAYTDIGAGRSSVVHRNRNA